LPTLGTTLMIVPLSFALRVSLPCRICAYIIESCPLTNQPGLVLTASDFYDLIDHQHRYLLTSPICKLSILRDPSYNDQSQVALVLGAVVLSVLGRPLRQASKALQPMIVVTLVTAIPILLRYVRYEMMKFIRSSLAMLRISQWP